MKTIVIVLVILTIVAYSSLFYYLATYEAKCSKEGFVVDRTGILEECLPGSPDINNPYKCFDVKYIDGTTKETKSIKAKIEDTYYIDISGYLAPIPYGNIATLDKKSYMSKSGILSLCIPGSADYTDISKCYDVKYIDGLSKLPNQTKAKIENSYYIDSAGYLAGIPYGNVGSIDKRSYVPKTNKAEYASMITGMDMNDIDNKIAKVQQDISTASSEAVKAILQQKLADLQKQKLDVIDSNKTSNSNYNSNNYDITYHADPLKESQTDESTAGAGKMWVKIDGNLVAVPYSDVSNTTLYYEPGTYIYNSASYVPNYEESVYLSKLTNEPTTSQVSNLPVNQSGICEATKSSRLEREAKCNTLDKNVCASTSCCVLLGGEKCVSGDLSGPTIKSNYSDHTIINRDYYYYQGKCFGNCPTK